MGRKKSVFGGLFMIQLSKKRSQNRLKKLKPENTCIKLRERGGWGAQNAESENIQQKKRTSPNKLYRLT